MTYKQSTSQETTVMYRINLQPQEPELEGGDLLQLIDCWLADLATRLPAATVDGYAVKLHYFVQWWDVCGARHAAGRYRGRR